MPAFFSETPPPTAFFEAAKADLEKMPDDSENILCSLQAILMAAIGYRKLRTSVKEGEVWSFLINYAQNRVSFLVTAHKQVLRNLQAGRLLTDTDFQEKIQLAERFKETDHTVLLSALISNEKEISYKIQELVTMADAFCWYEDRLKAVEIWQIILSFARQQKRVCDGVSRSPAVRW